MSKKGYKQTEEHKKRISEGRKERKRLLGYLNSPETRKKISDKMKIIMIGNTYGHGCKGKITSEETKKKISLSHIGVKMSPLSNEIKLKMSELRRGEKSHLWKGGITPINKRIRNGIEFRLWREAVFARDNWTCQKTGIRGGILHPHHIQNFSDFPELRFAIDNGITLNERAHREFHKKYGRKNNTREQLEEFLKTGNTTLMLVFN